MNSVGPLSLIGLPILGIAMLWAVHLIYMRRPSSRLEPLQLALKTTAWVLIAAGLLAPMIASCVGLCLVVLAAIVACMCVVQYRLNERRALMWMLAISAERGLPLAQAARAFATDRTDGVGRGAMRLAELLEAGVPLPEALLQPGNRLPIDAEITARLEYESGGSGPAMIDAARGAALRQRNWRPLFEKSLYFLLLSVVAANVLTFIMLRVVPAFEHIFADFDVELPMMTQAVIGVSNWFAAYALVFAPLLLGFMVILFFATLYYIGWLRWEPAPVRLLTRPFHQATVLLSLARATEAGRPLAPALELLARWYPEPAFRGRLQRAAQEVEQGQPWCDALLRQRVIGRIAAAVLRAAERVGNLPWAMREMADRSYRRLETTAGVLNNVVLPLVLLAYALPIGFIVIALFLPLVSLIQNLT